MSASEMIEALSFRFRSLEADIDKEHEAIAISSLVSGEILQIDKIFPQNAHLIVLAGIDRDHRRVLAVQHYSQLDVLLTVVPKHAEDTPSVQFGFFAQ
jgi:hypothetical protein